MAGLIAEIESVEVSDEEYPCLRAVSTWSGGDSRPANIYSPAGIQTHPMATDFSALLPLSSTGECAIVGIVDSIDIQTAPGEVVIYSRDASGGVQAQVSLRNSGTHRVENSNGVNELLPNGTHIMSNSGGSITLQSNGEVNINGVRITSSGQIIFPDGRQVNGHVHPLPGGGQTGENS